MVELILSFFGSYLIEFMGFLLISSLAFRWASYRHSKYDEAYYSKFTREIEVCMDEDKLKRVTINDVDSYLSNILGRVNKKLPQRLLRFSNNKKVNRDQSLGKGLSLRDYVSGKHGLIASIQSESSVFNCKTPPNFTELTHRIMNEDKNWTTLYGHIPLEAFSRLIDILPSLFIVFGVFGTFIGISMALPEIAHIDFNNLEGSGQTLTNFVVNVTFAMKTSIAGIFFSLILTFLNTLFPIKSTRHRIFKNVSVCLETLWFHIHSDLAKDDPQHQFYGRMLEKLDEIANSLNENASKKKAS